MNQLALELDINSAVDNIRDVVLELLNCERVTLFLVDSGQKELRWANVFNLCTMREQYNFKEFVLTGSISQEGFGPLCLTTCTPGRFRRLPQHDHYCAPCIGCSPVTSIALCTPVPLRFGRSLLTRAAELIICGAGRAWQTLKSTGR